jgi:hypothetical protein
MTGEGFIYHPGRGEPERFAFAGKPDLDEMRAKIGGGYIQVVPKWQQLPDGRKCVAFCDEDGRMKGLPVNDAATALWHDELKRGGLSGEFDVLRGPVLCVSGDAAFMRAL